MGLVRGQNIRNKSNLAAGYKTPGFTAIGVFLLFGAVMASIAAATLLWRGGADGAYPYNVHLIFDSVGNLYGTTQWGGEEGCSVEAFAGCGVVFELSPVGEGWTENVLYNFSNNNNGVNPENGVIFGPSGNLYGTTSSGSVFELSLSDGIWTEQIIYYSGGAIEAGLTMDAAGNIFGTALVERAERDHSIVFELSPDGNGGWTSTTLYKFNPGTISLGTLVLDSAGNLYGTTEPTGGGSGHGTVYKLSRDGTEKIFTPLLRMNRILTRGSCSMGREIFMVLRTLVAPLAMELSTSFRPQLALVVIKRRFSGISAGLTENHRTWAA